jgi:small-conductance mechanosensitive channel
MIQKAVWSVIVLIVLLLALWFLRRYIRTMKVEPEKGQLFLKWAIYGVGVIYVSFIIRVWVYNRLIEWAGISTIQKIFSSILSLILSMIAIYLIRRLINSLKIEKGKRDQYQKWVTIIILVVLGFFQIRIWAYTDMFKHVIIKRFLLSLFVLGVIYLVLFFIRRFINSLKVDIKTRHKYRKRTTYAATIIYIIILIPIWAGSIQQWTTVLSVMGAGIALALHEVLLNIAGWVYIVLRHPYRAGDRIELGDIRGDVIDIQLFQTSLLEIGNWVEGDQSTGRVVHLPHGQIFRNPLFNYTKGFEYIWNEVSIIVTFESNWEKAKEIMLRCGEEISHDIQDRVQRKIDRMSREYLIYYKTFTPVVYTKIVDSGVKMILRYLTDAKKRRIGEDTVSRKILRDINVEKGVEFAYSTYRIYKRGEKRTE